MFSLKVVVTAVLVATTVAALAGFTEDTVGAVVSEVVPVLNDEVKLAAKALPARSFTRGSVVPPSTVSVKVVDDANLAAGVNVATRVTES
jgi:hypothetical protein